MNATPRAPEVDGIEGLVVVGQGGFATVFRGHQTAFRRDVAVKVLQRSGLDGQDRRRFERECQAMGAVSDHPGIVTLYDAGFTDDERPYLVMAYVSGGSLHDRIASDGPIDWQEAARLGVQLSGALETAHRAGILHRDIKPANVLHSEYGDRLSDFGIARIQGGHETRTGLVTASVNHAAPEILDGQPPSPQADVYGLASTLYEAIDGRAAFERDGDEGLLPLMRRVMTEDPADLRPRGVPDPLASVIERAMSKDPADRYATAAEFGAALRGAQAALGVPLTDQLIIGGPPPGAGPAGPVAAAFPAPVADEAVVAATEAMPAAAAGPADVPATTVLPATPQPDAPVPAEPAVPEWSTDDSRGPLKAVLIFAGLAAVIAIVVGAIVLTDSNGDGGGGGAGGSTVVTGPPTTDAPATTPAPTTTDAAATTTSTPPTTVTPSAEQLQQLVAGDAATVDTLAERWVPQLSAKRTGLVLDGVSYGPDEILADHLERRNQYGAIVVDGGTYNFRIDDQPMNGWFVTVVPLGFPTADGALQWCLDQGIDRGNCIAKFISSSVFNNTTKLNP